MRRMTKVNIMEEANTDMNSKVESGLQPSKRQ